MKIKTSELTGAALDWAVGQIESGAGIDKVEKLWRYSGRVFHPSTDWVQGGLIIEREKITPEWTGENWMAYIRHDDEFFGPTPLIAATRCFVAYKLGDEVDVPEELLK